MQGAAGYILDRALWIFGTNVENVVSEAQSGATNPMFQRSAAMRAFSRAMGDDMSKSTAGFANPTFKSGSSAEEERAREEEILESGF